jgi:hypothetical protein
MELPNDGWIVKNSCFFFMPLLSLPTHTYSLFLSSDIHTLLLLSPDLKVYFSVGASYTCNQFFLAMGMVDASL